MFWTGIVWVCSEGVGSSLLTILLSPSALMLTVPTAALLEGWCVSTAGSRGTLLLCTVMLRKSFLALHCPRTLRSVPVAQLDISSSSETLQVGGRVARKTAAFFQLFLLLRVVVPSAAEGTEAEQDQALRAGCDAAPSCWRCGCSGAKLRG